MRSFKVLTFGCQMNERDSEMISGVLAAEGFYKTEDEEEADLILLNTCSIREKAEQKFYSEVGRLKKLKEKKPSLIIAVSGCIAQQEGEKVLRRAPHVDIVFGNQNTRELPGMLKARNGGKTAMTVFPADYQHASLPAHRENSLNAFVNIMYGCDNFCSYCVVPFVRGREKSRRPGDIVDEVSRLARGGLREVTLLGQNVNSYGRGLDEGGGTGFPKLLQMLDAVEGVERIRFVTSHPKDLSDELISAMAALPKVCESIHLPMQSASDRILASMNRRYTFSEYMEKLTKLKEAMPDITLSTDIIVGFPGETEADYQETITALADIRYDGIFSFKYSKRPNTKALSLPGHIPEEVKAARLDHVISMQNAITLEKNIARVGKVEEVLVEGPDKSGSGDRMSGKSRGGKIVNFCGSLSLVGSMVKVRITEGKKHSLSGSLYNGDLDCKKL